MHIFNSIILSSNNNVKKYINRSFLHTLSCFRFQLENLDRLDLNQRAQFATQAVASWLSFRLQLLGVAMVTGIAFIAVLEHHFQTANPGNIGHANCP